jgi:6-phosphofructokinase
MPAARRVGIITAGGDSPGLNAAIRGFGKAAISYGMEVVGFRDGFRGLAEDRRAKLDTRALAGILTVGGTILGTSRDKPHRMLVGGEVRDMTDAIVATYRKAGLEALVCLGGGGTAKNALRVSKAGLDVVMLPTTIDNDLAGTDATIGFTTALEVATDAIDRLHSTAHSHHRIIVAELMGHGAGWLALGAGLAGGADVILIPEILHRSPHRAAIRDRARGTNFSIVASPRALEPSRRPRRWRSRRAGSSGRRTRRPATRPRRRSRCSRPSTSATRSASPTSSSSSPGWSRGCRSWATSSAAARRRPSTGCSRRGWAAPPTSSTPDVRDGAARGDETEASLRPSRQRARARGSVGGGRPPRGTCLGSNPRLHRTRTPAHIYQRA